MSQLKSLSFREQRQKSWKKLEFYLESVEKKGLHNLAPNEIIDMTQLYRIACSSLYIARNISLDKNLHQYLENLVTKGYLVLYCAKPVKERVIRNFFFVEYPSLVRKYCWYHLSALLLVVLGFFVGYLVTAYDSSQYFAFVPRGLASGRNPYTPKKELAKALKTGRATKMAQRGFFSAFLFTHNTKIGFLAFALGILLGLPTIYLIFYNGTMLGAMTYAFHVHGLSISWWAWILPHGITEMLAIILCGGAGLIIGTAMIAPGKYGRKHRLKTQGREAGVMVLGTVVLFFIAGLIEGIFRQTNLGDFPRYLMAGATLAWWIFYFGWVGREEVADAPKFEEWITI